MLDLTNKRIPDVLQELNERIEKLEKQVAELSKQEKNNSPVHPQPAPQNKPKIYK